MVIIYCYSIGGGILGTFVERKGPPPKGNKNFFKDKMQKEAFEEVFFHTFLSGGMSSQRK
jgi:hypothetical protein